MNKTLIFMTKLEELVHLCSKKSNLSLINVNLFLILASSFILIACSANTTSNKITDIDAFDVKNTEDVTGIRYEDAGADWIKSINYEGQIVKFEDGKCTNWNELIEGELSINYGKDSISIFSEYLPSTLTFCFNNGKIAIANCENRYGGEEWTFDYSKEDETLLESITLKQYDYDLPNAGVDTHSTLILVEITKTDDHGNWIERKFSSANEEWIEKRVIYYEKNKDNNADNNIEEEKSFTTSDLTMFGLHGHVLAVNNNCGDDCNTYLLPTRLSFTEDGKLKEYSFKLDDWETYSFTFNDDGKSATCNNNGDIRNYEVARYDDGRLMQIIPNPRWKDWPEGGVFTFKWNKNKQVINVDYNIEEGRPNMTAEFNDKGLPSKIEMSMYGSHTYILKYKEFDSHDNWIKCDVKFINPAEYDYETDEEKNFELIRKIDYYPNPVE